MDQLKKEKEDRCKRFSPTYCNPEYPDTRENMIRQEKRNKKKISADEKWTSRTGFENTMPTRIRSECKTL